MVIVTREPLDQLHHRTLFVHVFIIFSFHITLDLVNIARLVLKSVYKFTLK